MTSDGTHTYAYDAEGNITTVDGGGTAAYVYDALNRRVGVALGGAGFEYLFDYAGRRVSTWMLHEPGYPAGFGGEGRVYWDSAQLAYRAFDGTTYFDHQDWLGTERMRTSYAGAVAATFPSLPFGDGSDTAVAIPDGDQDNYLFAALDADTDGTDHAQFRQYSPAQGRWLSPDPYDGSYDLANPQTFNRYAYALNNPLTFTDPTGMDCQDGVGMDLGQGGGDEDPCEGYDGPSDPDTGGYPGSGIAATWGPCPDGSGSSCLNGDHDGEVNCASSGGCLQWSSQCQCWGAMQTPAPPTADPSGPWWLPLGTTANGPVYGGPGSGGGGSSNSGDSSLQLAQALGKTGAYSLNSPCAVPAFYASSVAVAAGALVVANIGEVAAALTENFPTLLIKATTALNKAVGRTPIGPSLPMMAAAAFNQLSQACR